MLAVRGVAGEMKQELEVYLHSVYAGRLACGFFGTISFTYDPAYVTQGLPVLSLSLPLREQRYRGNCVSAFFFGALPDLVSMRPTPTRFMRRWFWNFFPGSFARKQKERYSYLPARKRWAWLMEKGIEIGAIDIRLHGVPLAISGKSSERVLDRGLIERVIENPRLYASVGGQHAMIPVRFDDDQRLVFVGGRSPTLSTHFVKHLGKLDSAINELFCMRLARSAGLNVPDVSLHFIGNVPCLLIQRYDRAQTSQSIRLLHQESLCQAAGVPTGVWLEHQGGIGIRQSLALLQEYSVRPECDKAEFLARVVFDHLVGCRDISGRNISMLYRDGLPELAPAYDFSITAAGALKTPMSIGGERRSEKICMRHWRNAVTDSDRRILYQKLRWLSGNCEEKANALAGEMEREGLPSGIYRTVCAGIAKRASLIKQQLPD